jgi:hypothetical protein
MKQTYLLDCVEVFGKYEGHDGHQLHEDVQRGAGSILRHDYVYYKVVERKILLCSRSMTVAEEPT